MGRRAHFTLRNALIAATSVVAFALFVTPFAGADQNETLSIDGLTIAAQQGDAEAQYQLGMHSWGIYIKERFPRSSPTTHEFDIKVNRVEALKAEFWFRLAAQKGHTKAEFRLGGIYSLGWSFWQTDYHEAVKWYRRAAEKGHPMSQVDLGSMYENGQGVPQDYLLAHMWYNLGAAGYPVDEVSPVGGVPCCRAAIIKLRDELSAKMTPDQIVEAQRMAREWLEQHPTIDSQQ
jgi:uncharacterized protein